MAKKKRKRGLPRTTAEWEGLKSDEVLTKVFGKDGQAKLKREADLATGRKEKDDYRLPPTEE